MLPEFKGWKTGAFFVLVLLVGIANLVGFADFELSSEAQEWLAVILPLIGLVLRTITDSKAGWRK